MTDIKLKVLEALQDDAYKGIARIDTEIMKVLGLKRGDVIGIKGERETVAIVDRSYPADVGEGIIRIDGLIRKNAKTSIGEMVLVKKVQIKPAKKVGIAPAQPGIMIQGDPELFRSGLLGRAVIKGDIISLGGAQRRRDLMGGDMSEIFGDLQDLFGGNFGLAGFQRVRFIVTSATPSQPVVITEETELTVNPKAVEVTEESVPDVTYEDIGGLTDEIKKVREMVELPLKHPEIFDSLGIEPPKGVLLHGPPGTGKTLLAKAVANESDANFILLNGPEIMSKFYGESEKKIRDIFEDAEKNAPSIIFIDEIDAIAPKREDVQGEVERRVVSQILTMMDGLKSRGKVVVIGATNRPNSIDPALRRPGRFDRELEISVPGKKSRLNILKIHTRNMPLTSFNSEIAGIQLIKDISNFEENSINKTHELEKEIQKNKEDIKKRNNELEGLKLELKELEREKKNSDSSPTLLNRILNNLRIKKDEYLEIEKRIEKNQREIENKQVLVERIRTDIPKVRNIEESIRTKSKIIEELVNEIKSLKKSMEKNGIYDPRTIFADRTLNEKKKEFNTIIEDLINTDIISRDFYEKIKKPSIEKMLDLLSSKTHGFVGADISSLAKEAAMCVLRKKLPQIELDKDQEISKEVLDSMRIEDEDFEEALKVVRPSAMREVLVETPNIGWEDIGGLDSIKQSLQEAVEWPLKHRESFERLGIRAPRGILLYGPPGTGKTLLAKAVAKESEANFIQVKGPSLLSMWVGKSEEGVRKIFERARQVAPCVVFFDEVDALAGKRGMDNGTKVTERVLTQLLAEMDGLEELKDVVVIGATNRPDMLDAALLRPGRFDRVLLVDIPDKESRRKVLEIHTKNTPLDKSVKIEDLLKHTEGFVGADIESLVREAALHALRKNMEAKTVTMEDFEAALTKVKPSVSEETARRYKKIEDHYLKTAKAGGLEMGPVYAG